MFELIKGKTLEKDRFTNYNLNFVYNIIFEHIRTNVARSIYTEGNKRAPA